VELFVFRHGETDWNRQQRLQGHTDIPLNQLGREQAEELKKLLSVLKPEIILSSDLSRALETAEIANQALAVPIVETPTLRECHVGIAEGILRADLLQQVGSDMWDRWISIHPEDRDFAFPGGESKNVHLQRLVSFIEEFCLKNSHLNRIAISTHGGSLRRLVHYCEGAPIEAVPLPNCVLYKLTFEPKNCSWHFVGLISSL
jgi:broad specificity phosphatase PhoE